ncbi:hypothetical protein HK096_006157, partial [Nowakowskiella sp. JEL0078]
MLAYNLYNVSINRLESGLFDYLLYVITVPGIKESTPHLRIGDCVRIRRVMPNFDHIEHEGYVYNLKRAINEIYVNIPSFSRERDTSEKYNIMFVMDEEPTNSMNLAIENLDEWEKNSRLLKEKIFSSDDVENKKSHSRGFASKMLFPELSDAKYLGTQSGKKKEVIEYNDSDLNDEQKRAVSLTCENNYGNVPFIIWGPPGTGKTKSLIECILQIVHEQPNAHILACAPSDSAADTITERLINCCKFKNDTLFRLNSPSRGIEEVSSKIKCFSCIESNFFSVPEISKLLRYRVLVCTCIDAAMLVSAGVSNFQLGELYVQYHQLMHGPFPHLHPEFPKPKSHWTHLFIDEAAQASEPETAIPLSVVVDYIPEYFLKSEHDIGENLETHCQVVLCGDHKQLGPLIHSNEARKEKLHISWLERLMERPIYKSQPIKKGDNAKIISPFVSLVRNYRSFPAMLEMPSKLFYGFKLKSCANPLQTEEFLGLKLLPNPKIPIMFIGHESEEKCVGETSSSAWWNPTEVSKIVTTINEILKIRKAGTSENHIGVISPFRQQVHQIRKELRECNHGGIDVGTVEDFQGKEKSIILISSVRSSKRFLDDDIKRDLGVVHFPKRLNVAITRAKALLVIVGNPFLLE